MRGLSAVGKLLRSRGACVLCDRLWALTFTGVADRSPGRMLGSLRNLWRLPGLTRRHRGGQLNLGCVGELRDGFLSAGEGLRGEICVDVRRRLPFPDNHFAVVLSDGGLEGLHWQHGERLLRECNRILQPGGVLRLRTPDLEALVRQHESGEGSLNDTLLRDGRQHLYDREELEGALGRAGFGRLRSLTETPEPGAPSGSRMDGILTVEAVKPIENDE